MQFKFVFKKFIAYKIKFIKYLRNTQKKINLDFTQFKHESIKNRADGTEYSLLYVKDNKNCCAF